MNKRTQLFVASIVMLSAGWSGFVAGMNDTTEFPYKLIPGSKQIGQEWHWSRLKALAWYRGVPLVVSWGVGAVTRSMLESW